MLSKDKVDGNDSVQNRPFGPPYGRTLGANLREHAHWRHRADPQDLIPEKAPLFPFQGLGINR